MAKPLPSIEHLRQRLRYEPETGKLFRLDCEGMPQQWRTRWVGKEAFTSVGGSGYFQGWIGGALHTAHRVAWAIHHGKWPTDQIDHINGVKTDNRITNLREVSNQQNQQNATMRKNNTSGVTGVYWYKDGKKWHAQIRVGKKRMHLGYFDTLEEAAAVRKQADVQYGYSERHGLPINVGEACD